MGLTLPLIAIIDDDEGIRRALRRLLRILALRARRLRLGRGVSRKPPNASRPGCVLMDLHLPGLSGIEVLERMRDGERAPPVIVMTGFDEPGTRERCLAAGAVEYITKPIEAAHLSA